MNAHVAEPFRSALNTWAGGKEYNPMEHVGADEPEQLCPTCRGDISTVAARCEYCHKQFCLDCVAHCDMYFVCSDCVPAALADLEDVMDTIDIENVRRLREFAGVAK